MLASSNGMDYETATEAEVSRAEAHGEVLRHGADWLCFLMEMGDRQTYTGGEVLAWLGY